MRLFIKRSRSVDKITSIWSLGHSFSTSCINVISDVSGTRNRARSCRRKGQHTPSCVCCAWAQHASYSFSDKVITTRRSNRLSVIGGAWFEGNPPALHLPGSIIVRQRCTVEPSETESIVWLCKLYAPQQLNICVNWLVQHFYGFIFHCCLTMLWRIYIHSPNVLNFISNYSSCSLLFFHRHRFVISNFVS